MAYNPYLCNRNGLLLCRNIATSLNISQSAVLVKTCPMLGIYRILSWQRNFRAILTPCSQESILLPNPPAHAHLPWLSNSCAYLQFVRIGVSLRFVINHECFLYLANCNYFSFFFFDPLSKSIYIFITTHINSLLKKVQMIEENFISHLQIKINDYIKCHLLRFS